MSFLFFEIGGEKEKGDSILGELSMFEKQNQEKKNLLYFPAYCHFPSPQKGNANGALLVLKVKTEIMWSWDC